MNPGPVTADLRKSAAGAAAAGLAEDAATADVTTGSLGASADVRGTLLAVAKKPCTVCGWFAVEEVYTVLGGAETVQEVPDGCFAGPGQVIGRVSGAALTLLRGERVALNLLARLSGIATMTSRFVEAVSGTGVEILDTRKTTPGFRAMERYAVRCGGGANHRFDLSSMALFKDNHIALAGGMRFLAGPVTRARKLGVAIEIEVENAAQLAEALELGPERVLLDNMPPGEVRMAASICRSRGVYCEASGGVNLENVRAYAEAGVSGISTGALTHSAPAADISFELEVPR